MLNILFLLQKNRTNQKGTCPIRCRLTYLKTRKEFSTGLFIKPVHWQNSKQRAHPSTEENNFINTQLSPVKKNL
ncbi:Arm DNA-binding domain-containing protein [Myroides odoratus]